MSQYRVVLSIAFLVLVALQLASPDQSAVCRSQAYKMSLQKLPNELLLAIVSGLDTEADINAFSCVNRRFHALLTPISEHNVKYSDSSALRYAALTGQLPTARRALDTGAQVQPFSFQEIYDLSLLSGAACSGATEVFSLLLEHIASTSAPGSADLNIYNTLSNKEVHQRTPLFYASGFWHADIVRIILEKA